MYCTARVAALMRPGAPGTMAPVARELAAEWGVLEPLQTADSLDGQVEELREVLDEHADQPVILIGSSWGAMLGFIFAARHPAHVRKLFLVGSDVFEARYAAGIEQTRLDRLGDEEREHAPELLLYPDTANKSLLMNEMGQLYAKTDAYDPLTLDTEGLDAQYEILVRVWSDAEALRASSHSCSRSASAFSAPSSQCMATTIRIPPPGFRSRCRPSCETSASCCSRTVGTCPGSSARRATSSSASCAQSRMARACYELDVEEVIRCE